MEFQDCVRILEERQQIDTSNIESCPCVVEAFQQSEICQVITDQTQNSRISETEFDEMSNFELVNLFTLIQGERVQIYRTYDDALFELVSRNQLNNYNFLCAEVTSHFKVISQKVLSIKNLLQVRGADSFSQQIHSIQQLEKEKLVLTASKHIELIREAMPSLRENPTFGAALPNQKAYVTQQIQQIEQQVAEKMEEIQMEKCELMTDLT